MAAKEESAAAEAEEGDGGGEGSGEEAAPKAPTKKKRGGVVVPEYWPWEEAKKIFEKPDVLPANEVELEWKAPDVDGLVQFLVNEKGFKCVVFSFVFLSFLSILPGLIRDGF